MTITVSPNRTEEILNMIEAGKYEGILLTEFMQVSFLMLMDEKENHIEKKIMYGGNLYELHSCVGQVNPGHQVEALRDKQ